MIDCVLEGNCLELFPLIPSGSVDMILADLPYGTTRNVWDVVIPMEPLWKEYRRVIKPNGAIVLMGQGMFSAQLMMAAPDIYRYSLVWKKNKARGFLNANRQPLRLHEDILVFSRKQPTYNPQKTTGHTPVHAYTKHTTDGTNYGRTRSVTGGGSTERYPTSVLEIPVVNNESGVRLHPTQKPVALGLWLIRTYTHPGDLVVDNACGSGSFLVAAKACGRHYIGMEREAEYVCCSRRRLEESPLEGEGNGN